MSPTPSPSPSPAPSSAPTATALSNLGTAGHNFDGLDSILEYQRSASGMLSGFKTYPTEAVFTLVYDGPSQTRYSIYAASNIPPHNTQATVLSLPFGTAQKDNGASTSAFGVYRNLDSGANYKLTLLVPGSGNPQIANDFMGIGAAEGSLADAFGNSTNYYRAFSYGFPAEQSAVPTTGSATYTGIVIGRAVSPTGTHVYLLTGSFTLNTDFVTQNFSGQVTLRAADDQTGAVFNLGPYPIAMNGIARPLNAINAYIGAGRDVFRAQLGGPTAAELGGAFALTIPDPADAAVTLTVSAAVAARRPG